MKEILYILAEHSILEEAPLALVDRPLHFLSLPSMAASNSNSSKKPSAQDRVVYSEFGQPDNSAALERGTSSLPPQQQNLRVETSRSGRKGKTVTIVRGFQTKPETLTELLKQLKTQCGAGGTVKENEIEIQGDHKQKILELLLQLGYKAKGSGG